MRPFLLDTHAWVWFLTSPELLPSSLLARLEAARRRKALYISAITPWEVAVLAQKGRIALALESWHWLKKALQVEGIRVIPLDVGIVLDGAYMDLPHPDPADRFIAATALRLGAVLITKDANLRRHPRLDTLWE
ncbi:hypothetical protein TCCBUS3UF1_1360 [Thermus sp. CCB_US3_UF1]|uniref:type II toxin-antitoxin system VapC family toxin n=1 Tax=Thermus sp. CCB_US3_UF1 TaxID=1111069 RepID=UPI000238958A|nr:type II toxin-antitoxin system VapC family toxin [Thermus sp. CCB_US3_UF1]AEV15186.1 hypothetical protein TCCBUS3UF1_1360 [Thermus sp. CCB_US3_UF1]